MGTPTEKWILGLAENEEKGASPLFSVYVTKKVVLCYAWVSMRLEPMTFSAQVGISAK